MAPHNAKGTKNTIFPFVLFAFFWGHSNFFNSGVHELLEFFFIRALVIRI